MEFTYKFIGITGLSIVSVFGLDLFDASSAEASLPTPEKLDISFASLSLLFNELESGYGTAESLSRLHAVVEYRIRDLDALIAAMEQVAPSNSRELIVLTQARVELGDIDARLDGIVAKLNDMDARGMSGYRVNIFASNEAKLIPDFDTAELEKTHTKVVTLYNGVTYGEVLVTDARGNLVERRLSDLIEIGRTSDKISPALAHRLMELFGETSNGSKGWKLSTGALEYSGHSDNSDHYRLPHALDTVDIAPVIKGEINPKRIGELVLAAKDDPSIRFFQVETGPNVSVKEMQALLTVEWKGKISDVDLQYLLSKVASNGSNVHMHIEFSCPTHHTAYTPPSVRVASR